MATFSESAPENEEDYEFIKHLLNSCKEGDGNIVGPFDFN